MDSGRVIESQAPCVQCMKGTYQTALDDGSWKLGWHLTTLRDPLAKPRFGGTERELEAVAAYSRAIEELESRMQRAREPETEEHPATEQPHAAMGKGRGRGGDRQGKAAAAPP